MVYQNHKRRSFRVRRGVPQGSILGPVLYSRFIDDLPASLSSSASCSPYADNLAICSSSSSVPVSVKATQGALIELERWSEYWFLSLNSSKCEASFFSVDPHQANFQPHLLLLNSRLRFYSDAIFLEIAFNRTFSFTKHVSSLKAKFFPRFQYLTLYLCSLMGSSEESLSFL